MRAYSLDLRQKVVAAYERGEGTIDETAALFSVGPTFVKKMLRLHRESGDLSPLPHGGGHTPKLSDKHLHLLRAEIKRNNDVTIEELRELLAGQRSSRYFGLPKRGREKNWRRRW